MSKVEIRDRLGSYRPDKVRPTDVGTAVQVKTLLSIEVSLDCGSSAPYSSFVLPSLRLRGCGP
jgi:hypothetical protein